MYSYVYILSLSLKVIPTTTYRVCSYGQGAPPHPPGRNVDITSIPGKWVPEGMLVFAEQTRCITCVGRALYQGPSHPPNIKLAMSKSLENCR